MYTAYATAAKPPRGRVFVSELEHVIRIRDGRIEGVLEPGRHRVSRTRDRLWTDLATPQVLVVPSQEVLTTDGATVRVTVSSLVRITEPMTTVRAGEWRGRWHLDVQNALRSNVTTSSLDELIENRSGLDENIRAELEEPAGALGLTIDDIGLRDLVAVGDLKRLLADVVGARLEGQAALERARGESAAMRNLANAASLMKDNPELYKIRLLQELSKTSGNTFVIETDLT